MGSLSLSSTSSWLGLAAQLFSLVCLGALLWAHLLPTGQHPIRDAVSNYGVGRHRGWYRTAAVSLGIAGLLIAAGVALDVQPTPIAVVVLLAVFGVARLLIGWFPTDLEGEPPTISGRVHMLLALVAFTAVPVAAGLLNGRIQAGGPGEPLSSTLRALGAATIVAAVIMFASVTLGGLRRWFGLFERLFYLSMIAWMGGVACALETGLFP